MAPFLPEIVEKRGSSSAQGASSSMGKPRSIATPVAADCIPGQVTNAFTSRSAK
jgi:hypothetical protein